MNKDLFERLLYEEESTTLDFKKEQYRFSKATEVEKSELLKDVIGFSNAWRRSPAYILIGVEEVQGGKAKVVGIAATTHLADHSLQQFVNNLTNQPVHFHYEAFGFEGKQVGIISIDEQTRPIYLKRDYGKLLKEKVYIRRGSSTDPTKPASLEEIAQMRLSSSQAVAELIVEFADLEQDDALGNKISLDAEFCEMPAIETIPDFKILRQHPFLGNIDFDVNNQTNRDFFREFAQFEFARRVFRPIRLVVKNIGQVAANNVRIELTFQTNVDAKVLYSSKIPDQPTKQIGLLSNTILQNINSAFHHEPGEVIIDKNSDRFRVEIDCNDLQPGRRVWSDIFYFGKATSGELSLNGSIFADTLPEPKDFKLTIEATVTRTSMTVEELCALSN